MNWISVEDELPNFYERVLLFFNKSVAIGKRKEDGQGGFFFDVHFSRHHNVTHWMPLPLPPEEDNK